MTHRVLRTICLLVATVAAMTAGAIAPGDSIEASYSVGAIFGTGNSTFAPHHISANRGGTVTGQHTSLVWVAVKHDMDTTRRLSWGAGAELWGGYSSGASYDRYDPASDALVPGKQHPASFWIQQLYFEGKHRSVFLVVGQKDINPGLVSRDLSSGDLIMSGNARPPAGLRAGLRWVDLPLTRGKVQIKGEGGYYRFGDSQWLRHHYNYYNNFITVDYWFNYNNIYLRTNPSRRFVFTLGMQVAYQFAGTWTCYEYGKMTTRVKMDADAKAFLRAIIPGSGGKAPGDYYSEGNHVGSWDLALDYKAGNNTVLRAYYQSPWEDGSGLGKLNGFDGLWGIEYRSGKRSLISGAVIEFIDLMNQSGPMHFAYKDFKDDDHPTGSEVGHATTGADDYYNNYCYNSYQNRGMTIGTPMVANVLYNTDGYLRITDNRLRGFHMAITGNVSRDVSYRAMMSWRKSWGTPYIPRLQPVAASSMMLECTWQPQRLKGLQLQLQMAHDHGKLTGNNTGATLAISYNGNFGLR